MTTPTTDRLKYLSGEAGRCSQCRNHGTVKVLRHPIYCTDSDDEIADAYEEEPCPLCERRTLAKALLDAAEENARLKSALTEIAGHLYEKQDMAALPRDG